MIDPGLRGRIALVTGAGHGIGAAIARALAHQGAAVLVTDRRGAEAVAAEIAAGGGRAVALTADLRDAAVAARLFDHAERELGPVELLVHNATGWVKDTFLPHERDRFGRELGGLTAAGHDRQFAVDARAGALLIAELARRHVARGARDGRILTLTSGGPDGFPEEVSYGAAKAALVSYTMSAAAELAGVGIAANALHPPITDTGWITDEVEAAARETGFRRVASPEDVAEVAVLLLSSAARYASGNVVRMP